MRTQKIKFGIDLGTTNSAIVKFEEGKMVIIKSELQKDTTPSCVSFTKKGGIRVGESALNGYRSDLRIALRKSEDPSTNTFIEFKRTMGTDKLYQSSNTNASYSSEELSSEVLKKLRSYVDNDPVDSAIITVPAKFRQNQLDATQRAADMAGFKYVELLPEPIAASIAYGLETKNLNGFWLVFDFGGGTFDAALMKVNEGIMKVIDTAGDNHLGGKNIDYELVDKILLPYVRKEYAINELEQDTLKKNILREALKSLAEEAKIQLTYKDKFEILTDEPICFDDNLEAIEVDMELSLDLFEKTIRPIYQRSIDIVQGLLESSGIQGAQLETIILVGGATYSKLIRDMLVNDVCPRIDTNVDPMIAVAKGAAIFASTRNSSISPTAVEHAISIEIMYPETTTDHEVKVGIKVEDHSQNYRAQITRTDGGWTSDVIKLNSNRGVVTVSLVNATVNTFRIRLISDNGTFFECNPGTFTIIQGLNIAPSTLPYAICVDAFNAKRKCNLLALLPGLEKNQQLPAKGKAVFYTPFDIYPGNAETRLEIFIYEGEPETRALYNEPIGKVVISGKDIEQFLGANQEIELRLEVDSSRRMKFSAYMPYIDETIELKLPDSKQREYDADKILEELNKAHDELSLLQQEKRIEHRDKIKKLSSDISELKKLLSNAKGDYNTKTQLIERIREVSIIIDNLKYMYEWPRIESELRETFDSVQALVAREGDERNKGLLSNLKRMANQVLLTKDITNAQEILARLYNLHHELYYRNPEAWFNHVKGFEDRFDLCEWSDKDAAKRIIETAKLQRENISRLKEAVLKLYELLPQGSSGLERPKIIWH
jgi:molecular chaperone DnaK